MLHSLGFEPGFSQLLLLNSNPQKSTLKNIFFFGFGGIRVQNVVNERFRVRFPSGATFFFQVRKIAIFSYCALRSGCPGWLGSSHGAFKFSLSKILFSFYCTTNFCIFTIYFFLVPFQHFFCCNKEKMAKLRINIQTIHSVWNITGKVSFCEIIVSI